MGKSSGERTNNRTAPIRVAQASGDGHEFFKALIENALDAVIVVSKDGRIKYESRSIERMLGYEYGKFIGKSPLDLVHPEDIKGAADGLARLMDGRDRIVTAEVRVKHADGSWHNVEAFGKYLLDDPSVQGIVVSFRDVTELRQREEKQRELEAWSSALVENARDGITVFQDGGIRFANRTLAEITGYSTEEMDGMHLTDLVMPEHQDETSERYEAYIKGKPPNTFNELRIQRKDGEIRTIEASGTAIKYNGKPAIMGIVRDITTRKQAEEALKESEEKWRILVQSAPERVMMVDRDGTILYINRVSPGRAVDEVIGTKMYDYTLPKDKATVRKVLKSVFQSKRIEKYEVAAVAPDGTKLYFENSAAPLERNGEVVAAIILSLDISEHKRTAEELQRKEEYFRALIENSTDFIAVINAEGKIKYQSPFAEKVLGYDSAYRGAKTSLELVHPDDLPRATEALNELMRNPSSTIQAEVRAWHKDGSWHSFEVTGRNLLNDPIVGGIVTNFRDITKRKQAEDELRKAHDELEARVIERTTDLERANQELSIRIAEARQAEQALRESEKRYRELAELLPQMVFEIDKKGNFTFTNRKAFATFGYTEDEIEEGFNAFQTLIPEDHDRAWNNMKKVLAGVKFSGNEYTALRKDGSTFPVLIFSSPIIRNNKPTGLRGVVVDLSERKQMEDELRESENRFRALIENASDVIVIINEDGTIRYESPSVEHVLGYTSEELIGQHGFFALHQDDLPRITEEFTHLMENPGGMIQTEIRYQHKNGSWRNIEAIGHNLLNDPAIGGIVVNFRDVTERRRMEEKLRREEEYFRSLIENSLEVIVLINIDGSVRYESPSSLNVTGYSPEERLGRSIFEFVHPDDLPNVSLEFKKLIANQGSIVHSELRGIRKDGKVNYIEASGRNLLDDPMVQGIIINFRDITERKQAEEALRDSEKRFRSISESIPLPVSITRQSDGTILYANELFGSTVGLPVNELIGRSIIDFYSNPADRQYVTDFLERDEIVRGWELPGKKADGTPFFVIASIQSITYEGEQAYMGSFYDISER
ncbi:MAG: PAS domain S-box protein, partial [Dehalococcoidia bacterium]